MISMTLVHMELRRQLRRKRVLFFACLSAMPIVLSAIWVIFRGQTLAAELLGILSAIFYLNFFIPFMALFFAAGLISEEVRAQTLTYLLVRPISRLSVLLSKFVAFVLLALLFVVLSLLVSGVIMWLGGGGTLSPFDPDSPDRFALVRACLVTSAAAVFAYGAFFTMLGVLVPKPAVTGLVILLVWEGIVSAAVGMLKNFTLIFYLRSLFENLTDIVLPAFVHMQRCSMLRAGLTPLIFGLVCLALAWWRLSRIEFRLND